MRPRDTFTTVCPFCADQNEAATSITGKQGLPRDLDYSICFTCGEVSVFDSKTTGGLRKPNAKEQREITDDFDMMRARALWHEIEKKRRGNN